MHKSSQRIAPTTYRPPPKVDQNSNTRSSKASIIRIISKQISQGLHDVSETLNHEMLQELSAEIAKYCQDAIKRRKMGKPSNEDLISAGGRSLQNAINERMANVVEKEVKSDSLPRRTEEVEQLRTKNLKSASTKSVLSLFTKLPDDEGKYDVFLNIRDPDLMTNQHQLRHDYIAFKRSDSNIPFIFFALLCGLFFMITGLVWSSHVGTLVHYPSVALTIIFVILTAISFTWVALNRVAFLSLRYNIVCMQWYHKYVTKLYDSSYGQWPDNITIVCAALATGSYLVNLVIVDLCDPNLFVNVGTVNDHGCAQFREPPPETFVLTIIVILLIQIAARGVSCIAIVCSWVVCLVAINTSIYLSNSDGYVWMNILQVLVMFISYELERQPLRMFIKTIKAVEAGEVAAKLKLRLAALETVQADEALKAKCSLVHTQLLSILDPNIR